MEHAVNAPGLADAAWWIRTHIKTKRWAQSEDINAVWTAESARRTPLSEVDIADGVVDVAWFKRFFSKLKPAIWKEIREAAKYASKGAGHARPLLFADALSGKATVNETASAITGKRRQEAVQALGLIPLKTGKGRPADLRHRYAIIQEFREGANRFSRQRQAKEQRAADIVLDNLARTAGYADSIRLQRAMA